ncbi:MAG: phosphate ABC transporter substrate-binding protein [Bacteroidetes bacterium]|nr:phosphate ABC transporter substrate-binding protein [bacterium]NBP64321.1 phosphate ABC transporter substrate-binding protein [Bacteroidota bacterium]
MKINPIVLLSSLFLLTGATFIQPALTIKGSDTMVILVQRWTELFPSKHISFQVTGGGSGTGIAALINGTTDICSSSRPMKPAEIQQMKEKYNRVPIEVRVARDGISIYVNKDNPISKITMKQLKDIFTGKIRNWNQLGGTDHSIILYSRENNSGTYEFFKDHVLSKKDFDPKAQHMPGTSAVVGAVALDRWGIGYGGAAYTIGVNELPVAIDENSPYYSPNEENIVSGKYPISRFLFFYIKDKPEGSSKEFIDWVISKGGQNIVKDVGYFPSMKF